MERVATPLRAIGVPITTTEGHAPIEIEGGAPYAWSGGLRIGYLIGLIVSIITIVSLVLMVLLVVQNLLMEQTQLLKLLVL